MPGSALAAAGLALAALLLATGLLSPLQRLASDGLVRLAAASPPAPPPGLPDVALVALDPQSLRVFPDWPWSRELYARALERLDAAGARAVGFDIDFSTPRDPSGDAHFTAEVARSGRVVLAAFRQQQELPGGGALEIANLPFPALARSAAALGSVLMPVDPDGVVRLAPRGSSVNGRELASLAEAALAVALHEPAGPRAGGRFRVDYRRAQPAIPVLSIADVIEGRFDAGVVAGRVVLIGATAAEFQDLWPTPLGPARPGVWIQAVALRTLAAERAGLPVLREAPAAAVLLAAAVLCAAAAGLGRLSPGRRAAGAALLLPGALVASVALTRQSGWLLDPVVPLGAAAVQYALGLERVRERLGRVAAQRERSLATLLRVGEAATTPAAASPLEVALALLGDVVDASGVALLRAAPGVGLDGRRLEWRRRGDAPIGAAEAAEAALDARATRVFEGALPGAPSRRGVAAYTPLFAGELAVGVLVVEREGGEALDAMQLRTISTVGTQIALTAENLRLLDGLRQTFDSSIEAIASAVEARDGYTEMHCRRLAVFAVAMAERLGLAPEEIEAIRLGALLHDVGKIGIRDEVLLKPDRFSGPERAEMERHAAIGHRIVEGIHGLTSTTASCVRHHHERWNGCGYPDGLAAEEIPLGARIVAIVDVWDALSTARPYKPAYPQERVRELLRKERGEQFDPDLVELFLAILDEQGEEMLALLDAGRAA